MESQEYVGSLQLERHNTLKWAIESVHYYFIEKGSQITQCVVSTLQSLPDAILQHRPLPFPDGGGALRRTESRVSQPDCSRLYPKSGNECYIQQTSSGAKRYHHVL